MPPKKGIPRGPYKKLQVREVSEAENEEVIPNEETQEVRMKWDKETVTTLLSLRLNLLLSTFEGNRSAQQLSIAWSKLTLQLNCHHGITCEPVQVKNKYFALRSEYSKIRELEGVTGNEGMIIYPDYWDSLCLYLQEKAGLGNIDYGQTKVFPTESFIDALGGVYEESNQFVIEEVSASNWSSLMSSEHSLLATEKCSFTSTPMKNTKATFPKKARVEVGEGLIKMAEIMPEGMRNSKDSEFSSILNALELKLEKSNKINQALLKFLEEQSKK